MKKNKLNFKLFILFFINVNIPSKAMQNEYIIPSYKVYNGIILHIYSAYNKDGSIYYYDQYQRCYDTHGYYYYESDQQVKAFNFFINFIFSQDPNNGYYLDPYTNEPIDLYNNVYLSKVLKDYNININNQFATQSINEKTKSLQYKEKNINKNQKEEEEDIKHSETKIISSINEKAKSLPYKEKSNSSNKYNNKLQNNDSEIINLNEEKYQSIKIETPVNSEYILSKQNFIVKQEYTHHINEEGNHYYTDENGNSYNTDEKGLFFFNHQNQFPYCFNFKTCVLFCYNYNEKSYDYYSSKLANKKNRALKKLRRDQYKFIKEDDHSNTQVSNESPSNNNRYVIYSSNTDNIYYPDTLPYYPKQLLLYDNCAINVTNSPQYKELIIYFENLYILLSMNKNSDKSLKKFVQQRADKTELIFKEYNQKKQYNNNPHNKKKEKNLNRINTINTVNKILDMYIIDKNSDDDFLQQCLYFLITKIFAKLIEHNVFYNFKKYEHNKEKIKNINEKLKNTIEVLARLLEALNISKLNEVSLEKLKKIEEIQKPYRVKECDYLKPENKDNFFVFLINRIEECIKEFIISPIIEKLQNVDINFDNVRVNPDICNKYEYFMEKNKNILMEFLDKNQEKVNMNENYIQQEKNKIEQKVEEKETKIETISENINISTYETKSFINI
jgi:hypothetical protein